MFDPLEGAKFVRSLPHLLSKTHIDATTQNQHLLHIDLGVELELPDGATVIVSKKRARMLGFDPDDKFLKGVQGLDVYTNRIEFNPFEGAELVDDGVDATTIRKINYKTGKPRFNHFYSGATVKLADGVEVQVSPEKAKELGFEVHPAKMTMSEYLSQIANNYFNNPE